MNIPDDFRQRLINKIQLKLDNKLRSIEQELLKKGFKRNEINYKLREAKHLFFQSLNTNSISSLVDSYINNYYDCFFKILKCNSIEELLLNEIRKVKLDVNFNLKLIK